MSDKFAYFKTIKARSVAIMGANNRVIFYLDRPIKVTDDGDIYIFRKKSEKLIETNEYGVPLNPDANDYVQTEQGVVRRRSAPLSHSTFGGNEAAKRKQLEAEAEINRKETDRSEEEKPDIDTELSAEDDLTVDDDDFDFEDEDEDEEEEKPKKKKSKTKVKTKKKKETKKSTTKKKSTSTNKKEVTKSKKKKKKKDSVDERLRKMRGLSS